MVEGGLEEGKTYTHYPLIKLSWQMDHHTFKIVQSCVYV